MVRNALNKSLNLRADDDVGAQRRKRKQIDHLQLLLIRFGPAFALRAEQNGIRPSCLRVSKAGQRNKQILLETWMTARGRLSAEPFLKLQSVGGMDSP